MCCIMTFLFLSLGARTEILPFFPKLSYLLTGKRQCPACAPHGDKTWIERFFSCCSSPRIAEHAFFCVILSGDSPRTLPGTKSSCPASVWRNVTLWTCGEAHQKNTGMISSRDVAGISFQSADRPVLLLFKRNTAQSRRQIFSTTFHMKNPPLHRESRGFFLQYGNADAGQPT